MNVIVCASRKGGSGKSTLTAHLAAQAGKPSRPTLLIDADPQGSLTLWHGLRGSDQPTLASGVRGLTATVAKAEQDGYAWTFIDTPPNKSAVVREAIRAATLVVIPARPSLFDLAAVEDTIELARELGRPYAVVLNAAPPKRNEAESPVVSDVRQRLSALEAPVWSGQITNRTDFFLALGSGQGAKEFDPSSLAAAEIAQLWTSIDRSVRAINGAYRNSRAMHRAAA